MEKCSTQRIKSRRNMLRFLGFCSCGQNPSRGYKTCDACLTLNEQKRQASKAKGLCGCGKPTSDNHKKCNACLQLATKRVTGFITNGLCYCGKRVPKTGYALCQVCLDRKNTRNKELKQSGRCQCGKQVTDGGEMCQVCRKKACNRIANLIKSNPHFAATVKLRRCVYDSIKRNRQQNKTTEHLLGCSFAFARQHIESNFQPGMTWKNTKLWHIDHHIPCGAFDLTDGRQQRMCSNWRNLRPLWAADNLSKKGVLPADYQFCLAELERNVL